MYLKNAMFERKQADRLPEAVARGEVSRDFMSDN